MRVRTYVAMLKTIKRGGCRLEAPGLLLICVTASSLFGQPAAGPDNAALQYLRAYAAIQQAKGMPPVRPSPDSYYSVPLDDNATAIVSAGEAALRLVHSGAALRRCDWGVSMEEGIDADTSHRGAVRELSGLLGLRLRLRLAGGRTTEAVDDLLAGITLARHLSSDGSLASALIAANLEDEHSKILALNLGRLTRSDLTRVLEGLRTAPAGSTPRDALVTQIKISHARLTGIIRSATSSDDLLRRLMTLPMLGNNAAELLRACGGTGDGIVRAMSELTSRLEDWVRRFDLVPPEFERVFLPEAASLKQRNGVFRLLTPSIPRIQREDLRVRVRRALVRAAVAVQRNGTTALTQHTDPCSGGLFLHSARGEGFSLQSRLILDGRAVELSTGPTQAQSP